jgi:hypothetical protein
VGSSPTPGIGASRAACGRGGTSENALVLACRGNGRRGGVAAALVAAALTLVAVGAPVRAAAPACGAGTQAAVATVDATAAEHIYANELAGTEVSFDVAQVTGAADLRSAVAAGNAAATFAAVHRIVFHPAWHIVRLRVLSAAGRLLADIGGPYVIAPVAGVLRWRGRTVGRFVMSVQDDTGETKLETRFVGDPIGIYVGGLLVAERYASLPPAPPAGSALTLARTRYAVVRQTFRSFPTGTLEELLLVPPPSLSLRRANCDSVRAGEFGRIAARLAALATALRKQYPGYAATVHIYTGADVFVRDGAKQLASSDGAGPRPLPRTGSVSYHGRHWLVFSFEPRPPARVYVLAPPA